MSAWDLPTSTEIDGTTYDIRSDYRAALDILTIMSDTDLSDAERGLLALEVFYPAYESMPREHMQDAAEYLKWFVAGGEQHTKPPKRKLADWQQDFPLIVGPVNRVLGYEVRNVDYLHWWTFLGAYMEIGECLFAEVVSIRKKRAKGKKLEKHEQEFYRENRELVDFQRAETEDEKQILEEWM